MREQLFALEPGKDIFLVHSDRIAFATPTPLPETRGDVPSHARAAERMSRKPQRELGGGGELMIFARDLDFRGRTAPTRGLTLQGPRGEHVNVEDDGSRGGRTERSGPPWAGCNYALRPGCWRLRSRMPEGGEIEQSLIVCQDWQTQVFVQRRGSRIGRGRTADLANAAVLMAKPQIGFEPDRSDLRSAELARQGLRDHRSAVAERDLRALIGEKPRNPMLGVYGAHLLIHQENPDRGVIREVARKLRDLVGAHPDVMAIELWLGEELCGDFTEPPMLKSSWSIIVQASAERPELVPRGSLSAAIAPRVLTGGPWLRWRSGLTSGSFASASPTQTPLGEAIAGVATALPADTRQLTDRVIVTTPVESSVITLAKEAGEDATSLSDAEVLRALRVPRTVAEDAVGMVLERLEQ